MNNNEKLLRLQWEARNEKMASGPSTPQGSQSYGHYTAPPPSPYRAQGYGSVGGGWGQLAAQGQRFGPSQAAPSGDAGQGDADWAGWGSGQDGWA